jgi:hypothetical protein
LETLRWVQDSGLATWIRESSWAIFASLIVHTLGMGLLAGTSLMIAARVLGLAQGVPLHALARLRPVLGWSLALAFASGVMLVLGYPAKALTNPLFYLKLALVTVALLTTLRLSRGDAPPWARPAAVLSIPLWLGGLTLGRFLAYTHNVLLVY